MATELYSVGLIILSTLFSSLGSFYMKVASKTFRLGFKALATNFALIGAVSLHTISAVVGVIAYKGGDLTVLVPLASLNYIWASILAVRFLKERMNFWKWLGVIAIMAGITILGLGDIVLG
jgi:uncharacterized membrane protein